MTVSTMSEPWRMSATDLADAITEKQASGEDFDDGRVAEYIRTMRMATAVKALGLPAVAVPVEIGDGHPQVVQIIGPSYREDLCLDAAQAIEDRLGILTPIDSRWDGMAS